MQRIAIKHALGKAGWCLSRDLDLRLLNPSIKNPVHHPYIIISMAADLPEDQ
jgi:hypothetical protein